MSSTKRVGIRRLHDPAYSVRSTWSIGRHDSLIHSRAGRSRFSPILPRPPLQRARRVSIVHLSVQCVQHVLPSRQSVVECFREPLGSTGHVSQTRGVNEPPPPPLPPLAC